MNSLARLLRGRGLSIFRTTESPFSPEDYLLTRRGRNLQQCAARLFRGWEGPLVLFQRERTKQTLDPYYECQEEHDTDYQQQQEKIELLNSFGFCIRGIHDYLLVPVIKFGQAIVTSTSFWVDSSQAKLHVSWAALKNMQTMRQTHERITR
jgi:hypothetical protein